MKAPAAFVANGIGSKLDTGFARDLAAALAHVPPFLPVKHYYGGRGDALYARIRELPEYPLFRVEKRLIERRAGAIAAAFSPGEDLRLVELGAGGDPRKIVPLLGALGRRGVRITYAPVDTSRGSLEQLEEALAELAPGVAVQPIHGDHQEGLRHAAQGGKRGLLAFLGSSLGNAHTWSGIAEILSACGRALGDRGLLLLGVDGVQLDPRRMVRAYADASGVTDAFNRALLEKIRDEIDPSLDPSLFVRYVHFDPWRDVVEAVFIPTEDVVLSMNGSRFAFERGTPIVAERSHKFTRRRLRVLAADAGLVERASYENEPEDWSYHVGLFARAGSPLGRLRA